MQSTSASTSPCQLNTPRTANNTYMNQRATLFVLQGCHESHASVSSASASISQQQKFWFSHHPSEQYPILRSESHSVIIEISAALMPMQMPVRWRGRRWGEGEA